MATKATVIMDDAGTRKKSNFGNVSRASWRRRDNIEEYYRTRTLEGSWTMAVGGKDQTLESLAGTAGEEEITRRNITGQNTGRIIHDAGTRKRSNFRTVSRISWRRRDNMKEYYRTRTLRGSWTMPV